MITIELEPEYHIWEAAEKQGYSEGEVLKGIYINSKGYMVATNGFIFACVPCTIKDEGEQFESVIIPSDIFKPSKEKQIIKIDLNNNLVHLYKGNTYIVANLLDGPYPDFQNFTPKYSDFHPTPCVTLNPGYYSMLGKAIGMNKQGINLMFSNSTGALFARGSNKAWGLIMPMFSASTTEEQFNDMISICQK